MRKTFLKLIATLPLPVLYGLSWPVYFLMFYIIRFRRDVAEKNIRNSFPDLNKLEQRKLVKKNYRNFSQILLEILKTIDLKPNEISEYVTYSNAEAIEKTLNNNQTIILALAHQCNQEWAILAASQFFKHPIDGIYKPLHQKWINELALESRSQYGITLTPAKTCITDLIKRSKQTRIIAIAPDQAPRRRDDAYWTTFLNQDTPFYLGLEKIAALFKYPVFFMDLERISRGKYHASFKLLAVPPYQKDTTPITQAYVDAVEQQILKRPEDWLWIHKRWKKKKSLYN